MPDGAAVVAEVVTPLRTRYHVTAPKQFRLRLYQFDFPGWQVTIDGQPAVTELAEPEGPVSYTHLDVYKRQRHQRHLAREIKRARHIALLPFVSD